MINSSIWRLIFGLFFLYIILCPFYVFPSGTPQPADYILAVNGFLLLFVLKKRDFKHPPVKSLIVFIILVALVNGVNQVDLSLSNIKGETFMPTLFYVFNGMAFILVIYIAGRGGIKTYNYIAIALFISIFIQCGCYILGLGRLNGRDTIFFNNPNQLGYYSLCVFTLFSVIPSSLRKNKLILLLMIILCCYLMLISESRAALIGVGMLTIVVVVKEGFTFKLTSIFSTLILGLILIYALKDSEFVTNQISKIQIRNENKSTTINEEIKVRGYDRMFIYSEYILFGAGEGGNLRFKKAFHQGEIHSGLGTVLFSYGILGLTLFLVFLFKVLKYDFINGFILLFPIFLYNLTHQGFRDSLFWMLLSFIYILSLKNRNLRRLKINSL